MGNSHGGQRKGSKQVVTVLQSDGRVLEFTHSLRVADLLFHHPKHFVCHSSSLVLLQQGKMLPPKAVLMRGEVYFLLPLPKNKPDYQSPPKAAENVVPSTTFGQPPREEVRPASTMKFLVTKRQLAKILDECSIKVEQKAPELTSLLPESNAPTRSLSKRVLHRPSPSLIKRAVSWSPRLESISEVPVI